MWVFVGIYVADAHGYQSSFSSPITGRSPHPLLALAGAVVADFSVNFSVNCLPVMLFIAPTSYGGGRAETK